MILFRVILFNHYPKAMKNIYFNDDLKEYYSSTDGDIDAITQTLRAPYDDPDFASFFADNLIVIKGAGQIQLSVRYNSSVFDTIEEKYGVRLDGNADGLFSFELERVPFDKDEQTYKIGELDCAFTDKALMYTYYKLVFDGVDFPDSDTPDWIRLKITVNGIENAEPYYILIYENTEEYSAFEEYTLTGKERP